MVLMVVVVVVMNVMVVTARLHAARLHVVVIDDVIGTAALSRSLEPNCPCNQPSLLSRCVRACLCARVCSGRRTMPSSQTI